MLSLGIYLLVTLIALLWVVFDHNAMAAFELFKRFLHGTARDMGMYWKWLLQSLLRAAILFLCVIGGIMAATWVLKQDPWHLGWLARASLFAAMLTCSIAILSMPHLSARLRLRRFLKFKAAELTELASTLSTGEGVRRQLEPAKGGRLME